MNTKKEYLKIIEERLSKEFLPTHLEVLDDSDQHIGHVGSQGGAGHYTVIISADSFKNQSRIDVHRRVYAVLFDLIPDKIHALRIQVVS